MFKRLLGGTLTRVLSLQLLGKDHLKLGINLNTRLQQILAVLVELLDVQQLLRHVLDLYGGLGYVLFLVSPVLHGCQDLLVHGGFVDSFHYFVSKASRCGFLGLFINFLFVYLSSEFDLSLRVGNIVN